MGAMGLVAQALINATSLTGWTVSAECEPQAVHPQTTNCEPKQTLLSLSSFCPAFCDSHEKINYYKKTY